MKDSDHCHNRKHYYKPTEKTIGIVVNYPRISLILAMCCVCAHMITHFSLLYDSMWTMKFPGSKHRQRQSWIKMYPEKNTQKHVKFMGNKAKI